MIRLGRKVIDREGIAALAGKNVRTLTNNKVFSALDAVRGGGKGSKELYDLEQGEVLAANLSLKKDKEPAAIPAIPDTAGFTEHELRGHIIAALQAEKEEGFEHDITVEELDEMDEEELREYIDGHDLLDLEEARMAVPADRRPTESTMKSYYAGHKGTRLPDPDRTFFGVDHWFRTTIEEWNREGRRPAHGPKGSGRRPGSTSSTWTARSESMLEAEQRRRDAQQMRADDPSMTVAAIADALGVSERQAFRYLQPAGGSTRVEDTEQRRQLAAEEYERNPEISGAQLAEKIGVSPTTARVYLSRLGRTDATPEAAKAARLARATELLKANPEITDEAIAQELGITQATAAEYRKELSQ